MSQTEIQLPLDVVLEISASMDLQHSLHLLATCKEYQSLSSSKAFWFRALKRITDVHRRPLPCPGATDLSTMALKELREMVIRAYTLMQNWSAEKPTPVSARIVQLQTNIDYWRFHLIPGTHLIVACTKRDDSDDIMCWDIITGTCLGSIASPSPHSITIGSSPFELSGQCLFAVGYNFDLDSTNVTIAKIHSYEWSIPGLSHHSYDVALDGNQIGMIVTTKYASDIPLALVFCNHHDKLIHCINTQLPTTRVRKEFPRCLIHASQFYIAIQNKVAVDIYHVCTDSSSLQATPSLPSSIRKMAEAVHSDPPRFRHQLRSPGYDVFAVTQGSILPDIVADSCLNTSDYVYFWPAIDTGAELNLGPIYSYKHGCRIHDMCYVAHPTPHTTFRPLNIPSDITRSYSGFTFDDSLGVLYIHILLDGTIAVFSFV
ncbi:hypothetical protein C8J57DRAFT_1213660 [Mycena rebaudengoi]|nr:hypothetical protein C8J57DRAFT_1213660 [Mycena rebaudengoi]